MKRILVVMIALVTGCASTSPRVLCSTRLEPINPQTHAVQHP